MMGLVRYVREWVEARNQCTEFPTLPSIDLSTLQTNGAKDIFDFRDIQNDSRIGSFEDEIDWIILSGGGFKRLEFLDTEDGTIVSTEDGADLFIAGIFSSSLSVNDFMFV